jgi:uncharacterized phage protein gp47/JayE
LSGFDEILARMLSRVSDRRDKRQGSIIYDTLAPVALELALWQIALDIFKQQISLITANGEDLDNKAADWGIARKPAAPAIRIGEFKNTAGVLMNVNVGERFSVPTGAGGLVYIITEIYTKDVSSGQFLLKCETPGTAGNEYLGQILPLRTINNLGTAFIIGTYIPGTGIEIDADLRERIFDRINRKSFGGNIASYKEYIKDIDGISGGQVFPVWDGGGTVKVSILDSTFMPATPAFILYVQNIIDPIPFNGEGLGVAPIGHRVTVTTPTIVTINITASITLQSGFSVVQVQTPVETAISAYIFALRQSWAEALQRETDNEYRARLWVFLSRLNAAIVGVPGVDNISNIRINGSLADLLVLSDKTTQRIPVLGSVILT